MMKAPLRILTLLVAANAFLFVQAQNLVPNPGFEEYKGCPGNFSEAAQEFKVNNWHSATLGTPDHFHSCSTGEADVPYNWAGVSEAFEGKGYAGIYLWMEGSNPYREYLQCELLQALEKDSSYRIQFHYKLSSYSKFSIDRIGLLLTDSAIKGRHDDVLKMPPTFSVIRDSALTKTTGLWETAAFDYKASGGERYLTLGNFFDNETTRPYKIQFRPVAQMMLASSAYYYVDDVSLFPKYLPQSTTTLLPEFSLSTTTLNTVYVLQNILFEFNSYKLMPSSFNELDQVADYLLSHPNMKIQLFGHTDDQGSESYNKKLSKDRASNVGAYLTSIGIQTTRIEIFGYGKSKPLVSGITEEARAVNRRVEVKFVMGF